MQADTDGLLVTRRAFLPIYRASIDGEPLKLKVANAHRLAVEVPAGEHEVHLWVDRRPFRTSLAIAGLTILGLLVFLWRGLSTGKDSP